MGLGGWGWGWRGGGGAGAPQTMVEMEIDTSKMPLGRLSRTQLRKGFGALTEIQDILEDKVRRRLRAPDDSEPCQTPRSSCSLLRHFNVGRDRRQGSTLPTSRVKRRADAGSEASGRAA